MQSTSNGANLLLLPATTVTVALGPDDLADLKRADCAAFSTQFVNLLIAQQHDAVELARMETATGTHAGAEDLARRIVESRTAQIATLLTAATHLTP